MRSAARFVPCLAALVALPLALSLAGCTTAKSLAIGLFYNEARLPSANVVRDLAYVEGPGADAARHRLNLFVPLADPVRGERPWPVVVFIHGGGWTEGSKDYAFGDADVYNNVGRFLARHGVGAAVISYRLMPGVTWREQNADAARAVAWTRAHVGAYGGDPADVFVMGHSAGAQLATRVALDPALRAVAGDVCGAIPVSGAALDLTDRETYALEDNFDYYSARFSDDRVARAAPPATPFPWQTEASPIRFAGPTAPPFLILYAGAETEALQRQSRLLDAALRAAGASSRVVVVPGQSHERVVLTLSRPDRTSGPAILDFVRTRAAACR